MTSARGPVSSTLLSTGMQLVRELMAAGLILTTSAVLGQRGNCGLLARVEAGKLEVTAPVQWHQSAWQMDWKLLLWQRKEEA